MRKAFVDTLVALARADERVCLLTGDLGFGALEPFASEFPERFFNVGVAEQNMIGIATGLAASGFIPYAYSIATFASLRPYEFIRNGPVLHRLPVRIVGMGAGMEYGSNGISHYCLEDLGVMRIQPNLTVVAPADSQQARAAILATHELAGPVYLSLSKNDQLFVPGLEGRFELGRCDTLSGGHAAVVFSVGAITRNAYDATRRLSEMGHDCTLVAVSTLSPAPAPNIAELLQGFSLVFTVEAHYTTGGLGSMISEIIAEAGLPCRLTRCGVTVPPAVLSGSQGAMEAECKIDAANLAQTIALQL